MHTKFIAVSLTLLACVACTKSKSQDSASVGTAGSGLQVIAISPAQYGTSGGGTLTVTGQNFVSGAVIQLNGATCPNSTFVSASQLTCVLPANAPATMDVTVTNPNGQFATLSKAFNYTSFMYIGRQSTQGTVDGFQVNASTGALVAMPGSPFATAGVQTYGVALTPTANFLYAANYQSSTIAEFSVNPGTGALTTIGSAAVTGQPTGVAADPSGKFLVVTTYGACAKYFVFSINSGTGALAAVANSPFQDTPCQIDSGSVRFRPDGKFVYFANYDSSSISGFAFDTTAGQLTKISSSPFTGNGLGGPDTIAVHPSGQFLYAANTLNPGSISAFAIDSTTGALTAIANYPLTFASTNGAGITVSPDGTTLYYVGKGGNAIAALTVNLSNGQLSAPQTLSTDMQPQDVIVDPTGRFIYTSNVSGKTASAFTRNSTSGVILGLTPATYGLGDSGGLMCSTH